ncbi:MAG TPA: urea ABC transporter permease subunit UrtB [Candidatus Competibacteraceae bacterium]|nr:urea ABC transporter permease subunit UrtB [Candidatus Competibacteraceae bacterium]
MPAKLLTLLLSWLAVALLALGLSLVRAADPTAFEAGLALLKDKDFEGKAEGIDKLVESADPRARELLTALLDGRLYVRGADARLVYAEAEGRDWRIRDALDGAELGKASRREVEKLTINNKLRGQLRGAIAVLSLAHSDPAARLAAVRDLQKQPDPALLPTLRQYRARERDPAIRAALDSLLALSGLASGQPAERLAAIATLEGNTDPEVRTRLTALLSQAEQDAAVVQAARAALKRIDFKLQLYAFVETLFFGLSLGSVLVLAAIGLAITFGVMGVINMAHGELMMLGAYTTYMVQQYVPVDWSLPLAVPAAFLVAALVGIAIERGVIRFLYDRPLETLLATFGISLILQQTVRSIFSPLNRAVATPSWMSGAWEINGALSLTLNRLWIVGFCLVVFTLLFLVLRRTTLGLQVRAVAQNRTMARAMGVRSSRVDALTFGLGSGIAGVAGVALSQLTNVGPNLGQSYIVDSFLVVVFGGVGNLWGTLVAGLSLGVANKVLEPWSGAVLAKILVLAFIILFIQKRPRGLFPQKGRAAEA